MTKQKKLIQSIYSQLNELKLQILDLDKSNSLLIVSNNVKNYDQLINCCKDNVKVIVFDQAKPFDEFKKDLNNFINELNQNSSLDNVGWVFDSLNQKSLILSSDYVIDLTNKHNVKQYQQLIDFINGISKFVKSSDDKSLNLISKPRFDLISCDLDEAHYNHMIQILELSTYFDYVYSSKIIGNSELNTNWSLDMFNNTTTTETVDLTKNYFNADKLNKLESGSIMLGGLVLYNNINLDINGLSSPFSIIPKNPGVTFNTSFTLKDKVNIKLQYYKAKGTIIPDFMETNNIPLYMMDKNNTNNILADLILKCANRYNHNINYVTYNSTENPYEVTYEVKYKSAPFISLEFAEYIILCYKKIISIINYIKSNNYDLNDYLNFLTKSDYDSIFDTLPYDPSNKYTEEAKGVSYYITDYSNNKRNILKSLLKIVNNTEIQKLVLPIEYASNPDINGNTSITMLYFPPTIYTLLTYCTLKPTNKFIFRSDDNINNISNFNIFTNKWDFKNIDSYPIKINGSILFNNSTPYVFFSGMLYSLIATLI